MSGFNVSFGPPHPPDETLQSDVGWLAEMWDMLRDRGVWGVPRSGVVFQKREAERELRVVARMPHDPAMSITPEQLAEQQQSEVDGLRARFEVLGITVTEGGEDG